MLRGGLVYTYVFKLVRAVLEEMGYNDTVPASPSKMSHQLNQPAI